MKPSRLCESLNDSLSMLFQCTCTLTERGAVRVRTPFMYPEMETLLMCSWNPRTKRIP